MVKYTDSRVGLLRLSFYLGNATNLSLPKCSHMQNEYYTLTNHMELFWRGTYIIFRAFRIRSLLLLIKLSWNVEARLRHYKVKCWPNSLSASTFQSNASKTILLPGTQLASLLTSLSPKPPCYYDLPQPLTTKSNSASSLDPEYPSKSFSQSANPTLKCDSKLGLDKFPNCYSSEIPCTNLWMLKSQILKICCMSSWSLSKFLIKLFYPIWSFLVVWTWEGI